MYRCLRWSAFSLFTALIAVSPVLAANDGATSRGEFQLTLPSSAALSAPASLPTPTGVANPSELQLRPMRLASVPAYTGFDTTLLATQSQPLLQLSDQRAQGVMSRPVQWAIYGAAIGLVVGLIDEDPFERALIGGAIGFGLGYVIRR
jgi:hypothetical protein